MSAGARILAAAPGKDKILVIAGDTRPPRAPVVPSPSKKREDREARRLPTSPALLRTIQVLGS
jgi:hypothetical protein